MEKIKRISTIAITSLYIVMAAYAFFNFGPLLSAKINNASSTSSQESISAGTEESFWAFSRVLGVSWDEINAASWSGETLALGLLAIAIGTVPMFVCLWLLRTVFKNYREGNIFSDDNASCFRKIGILLILDALIATSVSETAFIFAMTFNNPPGERMISVSVGSPQLYLLFLGLVIFIISLVMSEASKIHAEQQLTV
ncbi:DUF2975 domain-containing protein [Pseudochelatococcus sp. G4_1912]|uniref:DUF2975 domain-containing protein n=1 Tax=Pseudochelatococcus sp. G4_1912 TaxID=3114288 RepID=UPI0039C690B3